MTEKLGYDDLVELAYASALNPDAWDEALKAVAQALDADSVLAYLPGRALDAKDYARDYVGWNVASVEFSTQIAKETGRRDAYIEGGLAKRMVKAGAIGLGQDVCDERRWDENPWSELAYEPFDIRHYLGFLGSMPFEDTPMMHFSLFRRRAGTPFSRNELLKLRRLQPHLERAARAAFRLRAEIGRSNLLRSLSDMHVDAMLVVDEHRRLVEANSAAQALLKEARGLRLRNNHVEATSLASASDLARVLKAGMEAKGSDFWLEGHHGERLVCSVTPMRLESGKCGALLLVQAPRAVVGLKARLSALYGFTPAEADVAVEIAVGNSVTALAEVREVGASTIRTQLRAIFDKAEVDGQAQLARLVERLSRIGPPDV